MNSVACFVLGVKGKFRGESLIQDLTELGISAQIFFGIDASENRDFLETQVNQEGSLLLQGRKLGLGEVACSLGHLGIWRAFLKTDQSWALVFEDDAKLIEDITNLLDSLSSFENPTIVQLHRSIPEDKTILLRKRIQIAGSDKAAPQAWILRKMNFSSGAYAYLMNRSAAKIAVAISENQKIINITDWPYLWRHKVNFWETSIGFVGYSGNSLLDLDRAPLLTALAQQTTKSSPPMRRLLAFMINLLGIPSWKFHRMGYPGRIIYYINVLMPFKRRLILLSQIFPRSNNRPK